jgi:DNA-binding CsgD family transcriptional regulator
MAENTDLTPRQREVLTYLATWLTCAEIGGRLGITPNTVKSHASAVYRKLGVPDRRTAVAKGRQLGLVGPPGTAPGI